MTEDRAHKTTANCLVKKFQTCWEMEPVSDFSKATENK